MKLHKLLEDYDLHDSLVEDIQFDADKKRLIIGIELCNWRQKSYKENEPEMLSCKLIFDRVRKYEFDTDYKTFEDNEILEAEIIHTKNGNKLKLALYGIDVKVIEIQSDNVEIEFLR
ncbi:hypothetical protein ACJDU8_18870 [Clostridium sp. WILCCON 0269]|uniref:Lysozyme n=1 Tax=Candidatus Clostridium eludens TaxID=3381663 RepID=A0ABW8SQH3_9CLOT